jgi:gamma-glutamyl hercynylcysteine S-oxide synthase
MISTPGIESRGVLLERLARARGETDKVLKLVKPEALYDRPIPERHRIIFYLGHLEAFDWNLLQPRLPNLKALDPTLDRLFAFGIDPVDGGLPSDKPADWPRESQVNVYNHRIRTSLDQALADLGNWGGDETAETLLNVAIEHRLMHAETLSYILHQLPYDRKLALSQPSAPECGPVEHETISVPGGRVTLGLPRQSAVFGWDNEFEQKVVEVPRFTIDRYLVTNSQFLGFIQSGGYENRSLWTEDDWQWKEKHGIEHPVFWIRRNGAFRYRAMFEEITLPLDWPAYVSHAEARAYANWQGKRLPTEPEWHQIGAATYVEVNRWDPVPVNALQGPNAWEWTSSPFEPFPGFKPFPFYRGYSADFFDGRHFVLKGGSPRTAHCMLRSSFRNWFQPHYQYVYAGFRCASSQAG